MSLDFVQLEFFMYGYILVVWTQSIGWAIAGPAMVWFGITWTAIHREDADPQQFEFHTYTFITLLMGVWTGMMYVWQFRSPRLFDLRVFHVDQWGHYSKFTPAAASYIVQVLLITLGVYYLMGTFSDGNAMLSNSAATVIGVFLVVVFSLTLLATVAIKVAGFSLSGETGPIQKRIDRLNVKNGLSMAFFLATPAVYDYLALNDFDTWHGAVLLAVIFLLYALFFLYKGYVAWWIDPKAGFFYHRRYLGCNNCNEEFRSAWDVAFFILFSGGTHWVSMLIGWLVDISTKDGDPVPLTITFAGLAAGWSLLYCLAGATIVPDKVYTIPHKRC